MPEIVSRILLTAIGSPCAILVESELSWPFLRQARIVYLDLLFCKGFHSEHADLFLCHMFSNEHGFGR